MIEGILDTGFDGYLCLPLTIAVPLGLELIDAADSELADGTIVEDEPVFAGKVGWNGEIMDVEILLTKSSKVLIGTSLLKGTEVQLNFSTSEVFIKGIEL
jgi:clan AA aspartic protease